MGGSSGGDGMPYYASQDRLLGMQADIAEGMYNQYASYAPPALYDLARYVDDASSGAYEQRLYERGRGEALANNAAANALERQATARQLYSMGVNPNDPRFAGSLRQADVANAGRLSSQLNASALNAQTQGEQMGWARTSDFYNALAGMPTQSVSALSSAANGYGNMGNAAEQGYAASMAGFGNMGGSIARELTRANGGPVRGMRPREQRFAVGGMARVAGNGPLRMGGLSGSYSGARPRGVTAGGALGALAAPVAASLLGKVAKPWVDSATGALSQAFTGQAAAPVSEGAYTAVGGASGAGNVANATAGGQAALEGPYALSAAPEAVTVDLTTTAVPGLAADALSTTGASAALEGMIGSNTAALLGNAAAGSAASTTAGAAAGAAGGAEAGAAAGSSLGPWGALAGAAIGALLNMADGGPVRDARRKDMRQGGEVDGPGGPTDDAIPARLSDGEYVLNAEAVKLLGEDALSRLNAIGLEMRAARSAKRKAGLKRKKATR